MLLANTWAKQSLFAPLMEFKVSLPFGLMIDVKWLWLLCTTTMSMHTFEWYFFFATLLPIFKPAHSLDLQSILRDMVN